jgi:hypothetical protein
MLCIICHYTQSLMTQNQKKLGEGTDHTSPNAPTTSPPKSKTKTHAFLKDPKWSHQMLQMWAWYRQINL